MLKWFALVGTMAFASACGAPAPEAELGSARQAIVNGEPSDESDDSAVYVFTRGTVSGDTTCTGSVIAPNLVVTALHCITHTMEGTFTCKPDGTLAPSPSGYGTIGQLVTPSQVEIYAGASTGAEPDAVGARLIGTGTSQICKNDLGLVVLDRDLDLPILPLRLERGVAVSEMVRVVGYGQTETSGTSGRFRRSGRRVIDVGPASDSDPIGTAAPRTFVVNEGPCHGDSGGPAISEETGALLGVYSLAAASSCTSVGARNVFTRLAPFSSLILGTFDQIGVEPVLEDAVEAPSSTVKKDNGCSLGSAPASGAATWLAFLGGAAGVWLARRRRG
jgi:hypothetical protein